jgi:hypothetical protein
VFDSTQCYIAVLADAEETARAFKTAWFVKAARKALIDDEDLCEAIARKTDVEIEKELKAKELVEICSGRDA